MICACVHIIFSATVSIAAQNKPEPAPPTISDENHAKIRDLQRQQDKLVITALQLQKQQEDLQKQYAAVNAKLQDAMTKAMTDAKADPKEWILDPETLTTKKNPAATPPKPEETKKNKP